MDLAANATAVVVTNVFVPVKGHGNGWIVVECVAIRHLARPTDAFILGPPVIGPFVIGSAIIDCLNVLRTNYAKGKLDLVLDTGVHVDPKGVSQSVSPDLCTDRIVRSIGGNAPLGICAPIGVVKARSIGVGIISRDAPIFVYSNDGAMDIIEGIGVSSFSGISQGNIQLSVVSKGHGAAIVEAFVHGWASKDQSPLVVVQHERLGIHSESHHNVVRPVLRVFETIFSVLGKKSKEVSVFGKIGRWNHSMQSPFAIGADLGSLG
mmetsp:Transcript_14316/g.29162  ORF Transcript_14316/g.29162 Transcript_14316/m.29162 type:complete len:264 (+) Transcript_14316:3463-4254(+)